VGEKPTINTPYESCRYNLKYLRDIFQKAFKYRFFPTDEQATQLAITFGCARYVYNLALEFRAKAWQQEQRSVGFEKSCWVQFERGYP